MYATARTVRAGDVTPSGRLRLDAFARYLQEAAEDDVAGTGWRAPYDWLLRRCAVSARGYPVLGDEVTRLMLPAPGPGAEGRPWPVRASDFDPAGHVNNTVHWQAAEDIVAGLGWLPAAAELEYHQPVLPGATPRLVASHVTGQALFWLLNGQQRLASGRLATTSSAAP